MKMGIWKIQILLLLGTNCHHCPFGKFKKIKNGLKTTLP
jgi:hypothetical protein